jgi:hypothetical protein
MSSFKFTRNNCLDNWQRTLWDTAQEDVKKRVQELHKQIQGPYDNYVCEYCSCLTVFASDVIPYPCPTIKALDDDQ